MTVIEHDTLSPNLSAPECPAWCVANHAGPLTADEELTYDIRAHHDRERTLHGVVDELGDSLTAGVTLIQVDRLSHRRRGQVGVTAASEGVMTPEQAEAFATMVIRAAADARRANELRGC